MRKILYVETSRNSVNNLRFALIVTFTEVYFTRYKLFALTKKSCFAVNQNAQRSTGDPGTVVPVAPP